MATEMNSYVSNGNFSIPTGEQNADTSTEATVDTTTTASPAASSANTAEKVAQSTKDEFYNDSYAKTSAVANSFPVYTERAEQSNAENFLMPLVAGSENQGRAFSSQA
ncbi:MAG: hypothetical protein HQL32_13645 [Planctomycetes bacterium]|nr:hypothetical protein [Planctomycetota bacterium]